MGFEPSLEVKAETAESQRLCRCRDGSGGGLCNLLCFTPGFRGGRASKNIAGRKPTTPAHMRSMSNHPPITTMSQALQADRATLTVKEVSVLLGVDTRTVHRAIEAGQISAIEIGRQKLIPRLTFLAQVGADAA